MLRRAFLLALVIPLLPACGGGDLHLKIRFGSVQGLGAGDRVYFEARAIGEVEKILIEKSGVHVVHVTIGKDAAHLATEYARFYVEKDASSKTGAAIRMVVARQGGLTLKEGASVKGSTKPQAAAEGGSGGLEEKVDALKRRLDDLAEDLGRIPQSEAFKKFKNDLERFTEEMKRSGDEAREKLEKDILPWLEEGLDRLKEWLEREFGDENKDEPPKDRDQERTWT